MKTIWWTAPYAETGIERLTIVGQFDPDRFQTSDRGLYQGWAHAEGFYWHRTRRAAVERARQHRADRIAEAKVALAKWTALPPIT